MLFGYFRIARKNLSHKKERAIVATSSIGVAVAVFLVLIALQRGLSNLRQAVAGSQVEMTTITVSVPPGNPKKITDSTLAQFARLPRVDTVTPLLTLFESARMAGQESVLWFYGVRPDSPVVQRLELSAGRALRGSGEVIVTRSALESRGITDLVQALGQKVVVDRTLSCSIVGVSTSPSKGQTYLSLEDARRLVEKKYQDPEYIENNGYSHALLTVVSVEDLPSVEKEVRGLGYLPSSLLDTSDMWRQLTRIVSWFLTGLVVAAIGIAFWMINSTLGLAVQERQGLIGVMKAVGATDGEVMRLVFTEAGLIGFMGGFLGSIGGWGIVWLVNALARANLDSGLGTLDLLSIPLPVVILGAAGAVGVSLLAAYFPGRHICRLEPLTAIKTFRGG